MTETTAPPSPRPPRRARRAPPVRRRRDRRRRLRPARRDRRPRGRRQDRDRLQVAARQGAHRDGRGRHRRGHGQPLARGQLGGALPRHHAWREDAQQLADGPAARPGGARAGPGARGLGRAVRPHRGRADLAARLRRPPLRPARPRRRPHRPGDDPHPPAARRRPRHRRASWSARSPSCSRTATARSPGPSATGARPARSSPSRRPRSILATGGIGKSFKVTSNSWEYTGDGHALALRAGRVADQHGVRPVPPHGDGLAALGEGAAGHGVGPRRRRHPQELRGQAVHVRLHPGVLQGGDGRQRRGGRPLVRRQEEQPPATRAAAA